MTSPYRYRRWQVRPQRHTRRRRMCNVNLRDWCRQYFPSTANFAIELRNAGGSSRGILLKQFSADSKRLFKVDLVPLLLKTIAIAWPTTEIVNAYASTGTKGVRTYACLHRCASLTIAVASSHMTQMRSVPQLTR